MLLAHFFPVLQLPSLWWKSVRVDLTRVQEIYGKARSGSHLLTPSFFSLCKRARCEMRADAGFTYDSCVPLFILNHVYWMCFTVSLCQCGHDVESVHVPSIKDQSHQSGYLTDRLCDIRSSHWKLLKKLDAASRSESFFSLSLERQQSAGKIAQRCTHTGAYVFYRRQKFASLQLVRNGWRTYDGEEMGRKDRSSPKF